MAARRLVIVMIVLLLISTVVAIIAPQPAERRSPDTTATTVAEPEDPGWREEADRLPLESVIYSDAGSPERVVAWVGDRLRLEVRGSRGRQVAIPALGLIATQARSAPATFDLYFTRTGSYDVVDAESKEKLSEIIVREKSTSADDSSQDGDSIKPQAEPREPPAASPQGKAADRSRS